MTLAPLAARFRMGASTRTSFGVDDPDAVRAMQVVLRIERAAPPSPTALLEAAAAAAVAVCLDENAGLDGPWRPELDAWIGSRIRKVARRARGAHWDAVQDEPGVTVTVRGAQARALVPGLVAEAPKVVRRLQIGGTDLPADDPGPAPEDAALLWLNPSVPMSLGKQAAQVGHASMLLAAAASATGEPWLPGWAERGYPCAVRTPAEAQWQAAIPGDGPAAAWAARAVIAVRDAGYTEVAAGTTTVLGFPRPPVDFDLS